MTSSHLPIIHVIDVNECYPGWMCMLGRVLHVWKCMCVSACVCVHVYDYFRKGLTLVQTVLEFILWFRLALNSCQSSESISQVLRL